MLPSMETCSTISLLSLTPEAKLMKFLCLLKHRWKYLGTPFFPKRVCQRCGKFQRQYWDYINFMFHWI